VLLDRGFEFLSLAIFEPENPGIGDVSGRGIGSHRAGCAQCAAHGQQPNREHAKIAELH